MLCIDSFNVNLIGSLQAMCALAKESGDKIVEGRSLFALGSALSDQGKFKDAELPMKDAIACLEKAMEAILGDNQASGAEMDGMLYNAKPALRSCQLDIARACNGMKN